MMSIRVQWRRITGPGIALLREPITGHFRSGQIPGSPGYRVPGPAVLKSRDSGIHRAVHPFLVPGMVGIAIVTKEVDLKLLLFLIRTNLVQLDIILDQVLLGHVPGRGLENILERRSLIVIGLILRTLMDGGTKDIVLDLVHMVTRDLYVIIIPEVGSDRVAVLADLPLSKKRGVEFLALLLLLIKTLYRMSFQGQLQIMSLKEKSLLLLLKSLFLILRTEFRSRSRGDKRSRRHHHTRGRKRSRDKRRRSCRSPSLQEKRSRISCSSSSSDKDLVQDVVSGSITDNEFEGESVASPVKKSVTNNTHRVKDKTSTHRPSENCSVYSEEEDDGKISYAETIEEVLNLLPASICPRKK